MAFNINNSGFVFKKHVQNPDAAYNITFEHKDLRDSGSSSWKIRDAIPPWLDVVNLLFNQNTKEINFTIRIKEGYANSMAFGLYSTILRVEWRILPFGVLKRPNDAIDRLTVTLDVKDTLVLNVTPNPLVFNYVIGDPLPGNKLLQITSETNWTITAYQPWISLSDSSGTDSGQVLVGVDPSGLVLGKNESFLLIQDGNFQKSVVVIFNISEGDTENDYLYIEPRNIEFVSEEGIANTKEITLNLDVSNDWTATLSEAWLGLDSLAGASGLTDLVATVDSATLDVGAYTGYIEFKNGDLIKKVYVTLTVIAFLVDGIESEGTYFAKDRNKLNVSNTEDNTFLVLDIVSSNGTSNVPYQKETPFFKGLANVLIGTETTHLLKSVVPTNSFVSRIQNNIKPININIDAFSENRFTDVQKVISSFSNLKFLNGKTPVVANKLSYIPAAITVTNKAVLSFSYFSATAPTEINITGDATAVIGASVPNNLYVYNAIIDLSVLDLVVGNTITITLETIAIQVTIKPSEAEQTIIAFENEWNEYELIELTGYLTVTPDAKKQTTQLQVEGEKHTKVTSIDSGFSYDVATGNIYSQEEKEWIAKILDSKRVFIYINGEPVEIVMITKSLPVYKTREYLKSYKLKFKKAIV